jgi:hypothetical protein
MRYAKWQMVDKARVLYPNLILLVVLPVLAGALLSGCNAPPVKPYFEEVPMSEVRTWRVDTSMTQYTGDDWQLMQYLAGGQHLVWIHDAKAFDLKHIYDKEEGLENAYQPWSFSVIGNRLYVYGPAPKHGFLNLVPPRGWWSIQEHHKGISWTRLETPKQAVMPQPLVESGIYQWDGKQLHLVSGAATWKEWYRNRTGTFFVADPGENVAEMFELAAAK